MKVTTRFRTLFCAFLTVSSAMALVQCSAGGDVRSGSLRTLPKSGMTTASVEETSVASTWRPTQRNSIPVVMNDRVQRWVNTFSGPLKNNFDRWISRLGQYGPTIEHILDEEGVPRDLIYLAMIESGFNLKALSSASAAGPWQFIGSTGRMYGLDKDPFMDERSDIIKSTRAAARHLKDLYKIYGDWHLAFAAYNAGSGKVNSAIRKSGTSDYWAMSGPRSRVLRQETKDYVPKILAALTIVKNYRKFGYSEMSFGPGMEYDRVTVPDATDVAVIAKCSGTTAEKILEMNPALTMGVTAPQKEVEVFIPKGAKEEFQRRYSTIPAGQRVASLSYTVGRKDSLPTLAKRFGVTSSKLAAMNNISGKQKLQPGQTLTVPATSTALIAMASGRDDAKSKSKVMYHKVKKGETLPSVARRYGASPQEVAKWNKLSAKSKIHIGQKLKIYREISGDDRPILAALPPQYAGKRMSGVAHIIALEEHSPSADAGLEDSSKIDLPVMTAQTGLPVNVGDQPAEVRTEENVQDYTIASNIPSAPSGATLSSSAPMLLDEETIPVKSDPVSLSTQKISSTPVQATKTQAKYYTVKPGDTLTRIAQQNRMGVAELKKLNGMTSATIKTGQKLVVAKKTVPVVTPSSVSTQQIPVTNNPVASFTPQPVTSNQKVVYHRVKSGETLWSVSRRYSVTVADIKKWNHLSTNEVRPNQQLKIIAGTTVVSRKKYAQVKTAL